MSNEQMPKEVVLRTPDVSSLPVVDFDKMLGLKVTDAESCAAAGANKQAAKDFIASVDAIFKDVTDSAFKTHRLLTGLRGSLTKKAEEVMLHSVNSAKVWLKNEEVKRKDLGQKIQQIQASAYDELPPWEQPEEPNLPATIAIPAVKAIGFKEKYKPWSYELEPGGLMNLVKAIAAGDVDLHDGFGTPILQLNDAFFKNAVKRLEGGIGEKFPGLRGVRETSLS